MQIAMSTNILSQWLLVGASFIALLQSLPSHTYSSANTIQMQDARDNFTFLSVACNVVGVVVCLLSKLVEVREEKKSEETDKETDKLQNVEPESDVMTVSNEILHQKSTFSPGKLRNKMSFQLLCTNEVV